MRVLVSGSRDWKDRALLFMALDTWASHAGITEVIEGCARGADHMAEEWAVSNGIVTTHFPADWDRLGKRAGPFRNIQMLKAEPDIVFAFHDDIGNSAGTGHMVKIAQKAGIEVLLVSHPKEEA